jgi:hypothetical protein
MIEMIAGRSTEGNQPERTPGELVAAVAVIRLQNTDDVPHLNRNEMTLKNLFIF